MTADPKIRLHKHAPLIHEEQAAVQISSSFRNLFLRLLFRVLSFFVAAVTPAKPRGEKVHMSSWSPGLQGSWSKTGTKIGPAVHL